MSDDDRLRAREACGAHNAQGRPLEEVLRQNCRCSEIIFALEQAREADRLELGVISTETLRYAESLKYIGGIVERGEKRKLREDEPIEDAIREYVKKLEAEVERLQDDLGVARAFGQTAERLRKQTFADAERLAGALDAVKKDRAYQELHGAPHFTSAPTEQEWKAESARKAWGKADAALAAHEAKR